MKAGQATKGNPDSTMKRKRSRGGGEWRKEGKERREKEMNERRMEEGRDRRKEKRKYYLSCHNKIWHRLDNLPKKKCSHFKIKGPAV